MYICPTCSRGYGDKDKFVKHYLACWRANNPNHKPKEAPHSDDIESRSISAELSEFFERKSL